MKPRRDLATVLFTDIVGSTERASELGDRAWHDLLARHHRIVREEIRRWGGEEVTEAGDGFLALFGSSARAIACAHAARDRVREIGLEIRCGLHMGQLERQPNGSAGGIAVHVGARVVAEAGPGEVVVTSAVRDAEAGSGFGFEDLGRRALKGVDREWRLFRVTVLPDDVEALAPGAWERLRHRVGTWRVARVTALALLVLVAGYVAFRSAAPEAALVSGIRSLAVLPLDNLTGDPEQEYFADGMTEALITELSKIGVVRVISRRSVMRYKRTDTPVSEIADALGVDGVIEGSVVRDGNRVRITAQLIHAGTALNLWAQSYDGTVEDVLLLHGSMARDIAREIQIALSPEAEARLASSGPVNPDTYEAYLKGMFYLNKADPEGKQKGLAYLHEAVEKNPADALAYAGLALGYATLGHDFDPPPDAWSMARAAAERAVKLDPDLAEAHQALADVKTYWEWDWDGAEREFRRANELNPNLAMNHYHYAWYLDLFGRDKEAIAEHERAKELDPLTPAMTAWLGQLYLKVGRYEDAIAEARESLDLVPDFPIGLLVLGNAYLEKGMYAEAVAVHEELAEKYPPGRWWIGSTYAKVGRRDAARRILTELKRETVTAWTALQRAHLHAALDEKDEAFRWLAYEPHHAFLPWVRVNPNLEPLHDDPRFLDLLDRMGLPPPERVPIARATTSRVP
jgi:TolB-like protein/class 3 adenylate cyclase/Tfp pilus assembly protein PilF